MFGTSGSSAPPSDPSLPATSSSGSLFLPSSSASSIFGSSVIVPSSLPLHPPHAQLGPSPSLPPMSIEQSPPPPMFAANPLMTNLIASLASLSRPAPFLSPSQPTHHQSNLLSSDLFQNSLAERLLQSSSTPSSAMAGLSFQQENNNNNGTISGGATILPATIAMQNGSLLNSASVSPSQSLQTPLHHHQQQFLASQQSSQSLQKTLSAVELLQRALETIVVANANQQQPKLIAQTETAATLQQQRLSQTNGVLPQPQQLYSADNGTAQTTMLEQQLLSLLTLHQNNPGNGNHLARSPPFPQATLLGLNGFCPAATALPASSSPTSSHPSAATNGINADHQPLDLNNLQQRRLLFDLFSSACSSGNAPPQHRQTPPVSARKSCDIRRSASSVSYKASADLQVREHFQRTFSGKWPRRQPSLRAHLQAAGGGRTVAAAKERAIGESAEAEGEAESAGVEGEMKEEEEPMETEDAGGKGAGRGTPKAKMPEGTQRPKSRQQVKSVYSAVIRKLFTNNEKQVEDHFIKSLGKDRFQQIKNQQKKIESKEEEEERGEGEQGKQPVVSIVRL